MFSFIRRWQEKKALEKQLAQELYDLAICECWGLTEEMLGKDSQAIMTDIEVKYLRKGLTKEDIRRVIKKEGKRPVRLE